MRDGLVSAVVEIRPIAMADIAGFRAALDAVAREKRFLLFDEAPSLDRMTAFVETNIAARNPQFVALFDGMIVGWCDILRETSRPLRRHCGALGMGILSSHRGMGIGRLLLGQTMVAAFDAGIMRIELTVRSDNDRAIALYRAAGFVEEGHQRKAVLVDGQYRDRYLMACLALDLAMTTA